ncbi:MAG: PEP-CTERM sorting domain-containing protein [Rhodocyclaceae bacterium]|nr:PEP-CTERM sorting domain-containing protein [Rhodocyclaceae bacterium]
MQDYFSGSSLFYAWAVRDGDSTVAVPEPETAVLALMALMGMGLVGGIRCVPHHAYARCP